MKQTAVEWLLRELVKFDNGGSEYFSDIAIKNHATRMHKEKIIEAFNNGMGYMWNNTDCENYKGKQYYKETYGE